MTGSPSLRLFLAAPLPGSHLGWVEDRIAELRHLWPDARWIPRDNQHITMKFLGPTAEGALAKVVSACGEVAAAHHVASLGLTELGVFPSRKRARVLWIGLDDPGGLLSSLAAACDQRLVPLGYEPETRSYSPHLTVARFKRPTVLKELPGLGGPPGPFRLRGFDLWRSHLSPKGARYERLASFPLA